MRYKVGLIITATGKYLRFLQPLLDSANKFFFPGHDVRIFLFTNHALGKVGHENQPVRVVRIEHEPWPFVTLKRYEYIADNEAVFQGVDYLFWCDADALFVSDVSAEILPEAAGNGLVGVAHFGYSYVPDLLRFVVMHRILQHEIVYAVLWKIFGLWKPLASAPRCYVKRRGPYETRKESAAYVGRKEGDVYYAGGFWGGGTPDVLRMAARLRRNVEKDLAWGHIARWHDESHLNRYFIDHPPKILTCSYLCPEEYEVPFEKKMIVLSKDCDEVRR